MDRDDLARQGKQMASDLRDTVSQKVSENQDTLKSTLGRAARWVDEKTGGKYSGQIDNARSKVDEGIGRVATSSSSRPPASGAPTAPGATAGDPAPGTRPTDPPTDPTGPLPPRPEATEPWTPTPSPTGRTEPMAPQTGPTPPGPAQPGPYAGRTEEMPPQPGPTPPRPTDGPTQDYTAPDTDAPRPPQV
ncbi:antitoxin [Actinomycetospora atypica]|uniref:Rv0909 family putative TA system antitoxin n=1 Tax=Actinomycetospora atypica TaxID=1290095 RepID=A0ABV9YLH8_9PSEU